MVRKFAIRLLRDCGCGGCDKEEENDVLGRIIWDGRPRNDDDDDDDDGSSSIGDDTKKLSCNDFLVGAMHNDDRGRLVMTAPAGLRMDRDAIVVMIVWMDFFEIIICAIAIGWLEE